MHKTLRLSSVIIFIISFFYFSQFFKGTLLRYCHDGVEHCQFVIYKRNFNVGCIFRCKEVFNAYLPTVVIAIKDCDLDLHGEFFQGQVISETESIGIKVPDVTKNKQQEASFFSPLFLMKLSIFHTQICLWLVAVQKWLSCLIFFWRSKSLHEENNTTS